jgi:hypothetical protein
MDTRNQTCIEIVSFLISLPLITIVILESFNLIAISKSFTQIVVSSILSPIAILTLILIYFAYSRSNWSNPRTKLIDYDLEDTKSFGITLKNSGATEAVFRVRVWIDGESQIKQPPEDFNNSLFAQIPVSAPRGNAAYPKRTRIAKGDFRQFANHFPQIFQAEEIEIPTLSGDPNRVRIVGTSYEILELPTEAGKHEVVFRVQQTGEVYVFTYQSDGREIKTNSITNMNYGGKNIVGRMKKLWHWKHFESMKSNYEI